MNTTPFQNKICLVTGASSGIGKALSQKLNSIGAVVIITARNRENLEKVKADSLYPDNIQILPFDMENIQAIESFAREAWGLFQHIDYVFLNAGMAVRSIRRIWKWFIRS